MGRLVTFVFLGLVILTGVAHALEPVLIGRVAHIEGGVLRYVAVEDDWVATVEDSPLRADDILYTEGGGRAEFIFPNNTWVRIGTSTGIEVVNLKKDLTGLYVDGGIVRIYNRAEDALVRVDTRLGYLAVEPGDVVDLYVGDKDIQVIALEGSPNFFYAPSPREEIRYEVLPDGPALFIDERSVEAAEPLVDREWDDWNYARDNIWLKRRSVRSAYLPDAFQTDAYVFEEHGRWERVYYRNSYVWCWTPLRVDVSWRPFTVGRWTTYYEENVWVPYEPWGWVTHHYGHWIHVENRWWWTPYVSVDVVTPGVDVRVNVGAPPPPDYYYHWHPGRVAWIHSEVHVGWFPLAPWEPYYGWRPWYGNTVVVNNTNITNININIANYNYFSNAVIVNYDRFYNVPYGNNYIQHNVVNITNINQTTIINNYRPAPLIHKTVIKNVNVFKNQYNFSDRTVVYKPHHSVVEKAHFAKSDFEKRGFVSKADYIQKVEKVRRVEPQRAADHKVREGRLAASNKLVKPDEVKKPTNQVKFQQAEYNLKPEKPKLHEHEKDTAKQLKKASLEGAMKGKGKEERPHKDKEAVEPTPGARFKGDLGRTREPGSRVQKEGTVQGFPEERGRGEGRRIRPDRQAHPQDLGGVQDELEQGGPRGRERLQNEAKGRGRKGGEEKLRFPQEPIQERKLTDKAREERPGRAEGKDRMRKDARPGTEPMEQESRRGTKLDRAEGGTKPERRTGKIPGHQEGPSRETMQRQGQSSQDRDLTNRKAQEKRLHQEGLYRGAEKKQIPHEQIHKPQNEKQRETHKRQEQRQMDQRQPRYQPETPRQQREQQGHIQHQQKLQEQQNRQARQEQQQIKKQNQLERQSQRQQIQHSQPHQGGLQGQRQQGQEEGQKKKKRQPSDLPQ